jgi:ABC-type branched-subunit amino acid transport system substrate-binding protein
VTDNWAGPPNLFGAYGSDLDYSSDGVFASFAAGKLKATKPAAVSYQLGASQAPCQAYVTALDKYGPKVAFQDLNFGIGGDASTDVQQMKSAGVDMLVTCMEGNDNLSFVRSMQQNGLAGTPSVWLNGYSRPLISQNPTTMNNVLFGIQHVPFEAATQFPGVYPGMQRYITMMQKYAPQWTYDDTAFQGWVNADQFVTGMRAIGTNVTQTRLVDAINQETDFNAGGTIPPINWTKQHTEPPVPLCLTYVEAQNGKTKVVFTTGSKVFVCLNNNSSVPVAPNPNTPGA